MPTASAIPHGQRTKPRILFLGDSFVWGYDVEASARFTDLLARRRPDREVLNLGVSGYGTDQEFLLLQRFFERYQPDLVFLIVSQQNDLIDNSINLNYGGYYKPYFVVGDGLELRGVPVPRAFNYFFSEHPRLARSYALRAAARLWFQRTAPPLVKNPDPTLAILGALRGYLAERGRELRIGIHGGSTRLPYALQLDGFRFVDLDNNYRFPEQGRHWTPEGHRFVASKLYAYLVSEKLLEP
jgi:GDSL-like Lipase/Acylhydrolase family